MQTYLSLPKFKDRYRSEHEITREIRAYLRSRRILHWKEHQGLGSVKGVPDIIGCIKGRLIAIEVKGSKGKISTYQQDFIDMINQEGGLAFVAYSVEEVMEKLKQEI